MKKEHNIVMLPSENPSELKILDGKPFLGKKELGHFGAKPQHLYILSDEDIKKGDWCIDVESNEIFQVDEISEGKERENQFDFRTPMIEVTRLLSHKNESAYKMDTCKKIIATTDTELHYNKVVEEDMHMYKESLPHIPQHIIEAYVKNPFDKVLVEYLTKLEKGTDLGNECNYIVPDKPKLNTDGTLAVTIVAEKMYSREEVEELCRNSHLLGMKETLPGYPKPETIDEWIKENL